MKKIWTPKTIVKSLTLLSIVGFMPMVLAKIPLASEIVSIKGNKVMFQEGTQRRKSAQIGQKLENKNQKLIVSGNNQDLARLVFLGGGDNYDGLLLQAGPDFRETQYQFPCTLERGTVTIGWRQGTDRGCEEGIFLNPPDSNKSHTKGYLRLNPNWPDPEPDSNNTDTNVRIRPHQNQPILFQVHNRKGDQKVKAIKGQLWLATGKHPEGFVLDEGEQWNNKWNNKTSKNEEKVNLMQSQEMLNSEEIQDFLEPQNWSSDSVSGGNNSKVKKHLDAFRNQPKPVNAIKPKPVNTTRKNPNESLISITCQLEINNYIRNLQNTLNQTWKPVKPPSRGVWKSLLSYTITRGGEVESIRVRKTSGYEPLDKAAMNHVYGLENQFPPFPDCYRRDFLPIREHIFKLLYM